MGKHWGVNALFGIIAVVLSLGVVFDFFVPYFMSEFLHRILLFVVVSLMLAWHGRRGLGLLTFIAMALTLLTYFEVTSIIGISEEIWGGVTAILSFIYAIIPHEEKKPTILNIPSAA